MVLLEICIDSINSARNAIAGSANRIELCSALSEGGLTPSVGLFSAVKEMVNRAVYKSDGFQNLI